MPYYSRWYVLEHVVWCDIKVTMSTLKLLGYSFHVRLTFSIINLCLYASTDAAIFLFILYPAPVTYKRIQRTIVWNKDYAFIFTLTG